MFYQSEVLFPGLTRIWDVARTAMYLVEGAEKAVLIDTGVGVGDLTEFVGSLTDKPVTVLVTHGHVDHAMGAAGFRDVRISPLDAETYWEHSNFEGRKGYVLGCAEHGADPDLIRAITDDAFMEPMPFEQFRSLQPGDRFELGGVSVEVLPGAGHTPGSLTVLIPEWRVLLLGDACNPSTFLFDHRASSVSDYRAMLTELKKETDRRYDRVILSHGTGEVSTDIIENVLEVCDEILAGTADNEPFWSPFGTGVFAKKMDHEHYCRVDGKEGNIIYNPERI